MQRQHGLPQVWQAALCVFGPAVPTKLLAAYGALLPASFRLDVKEVLASRASDIKVVPEPSAMFVLAHAKVTQPVRHFFWG
jgi:hypothetical protein